MTQDNGRQALGEIMAAVEHALGGAAPVAVATVVDAGELGIEVGAKMLVRRDGTTVGSIDGAVVDAQGGVLPGTEVRLARSLTGLLRTTVTGADGTF